MKKTFLEEKLTRIINSAKRKSQWTDVIYMEIATESYNLGQAELNTEKQKIDLLIDFCGLIDDLKIKKEMLKKIKPFLIRDKMDAVSEIFEIPNTH